MAKKNAKGGGTIRKKTVTRSGKEYTYWEARLTVGRDPGTGGPPLAPRGGAHTAPPGFAEGPGPSPRRRLYSPR